LTVHQSKSKLETLLTIAVIDQIQTCEKVHLYTLYTEYKAIYMYV